MTPPPGRRPSGGVDQVEDVAANLLFGLAGIVAAVGVVVWAGAQLAAIVVGDGPLDVSLATSIDATMALPSRWSDPASAWPPGVAAGLPGPVGYWLSTLVVIAALTGAGVAGWRWWQRRRHGSGPFGGDEGGLARRRDTNVLAVDGPTAGRVSLGLHGRRLLAAEPRASLAVVGPTGCGKTVGFAIPALLEWNGPVIATSVKTDLLDATIAHRRSVGTVWVYDPTRCTGLEAARWSPLTACGEWVDAMRVATWLCEAAQPRNDTVSDGDYWYSQARKGLAPYLYAAAGTGRGMADVVRWVDTQEEDEVTDALLDMTGLEDIMESLDTPDVRETVDATDRTDLSDALEIDFVDRYGPEEARARERQWVNDPFAQWPKWVKAQFAAELDAALDRAVAAELRRRARKERDDKGPPIPALDAARALWGKESRLKGSVFATMQNVIAGYADPAVGDNSPESDIDVDGWLSGNNTIFVVATAHEQARLRPVLSVLIQQAIRTGYDTANRRGGDLEHPCLVLLDEAGNIAPLRDLPGYASTARSHGITFVSIWQDVAQIKSIYGDRHQTVLNNHRAKLFGAGIADDPTLEYVSRLIGDQRRTEVNHSGDLHGPRRSVSEHTSWRRLAPVDAIRRLPIGHGILLYGSIAPVWLRLRDFSARPSPRRALRRAWRMSPTHRN